MIRHWQKIHHKKSRVETNKARCAQKSPRCREYLFVWTSLWQKSPIHPSAHTIWAKGNKLYIRKSGCSPVHFEHLLQKSFCKNCAPNLHLNTREDLWRNSHNPFVSPRVFLPAANKQSFSQVVRPLA